MSHRPTTTVGSVAKTTTEHPVAEFSGTADTENVDSTCNVDCAYAVDLVNAARSESVAKPKASPSAIADRPTRPSSTPSSSATDFSKTRADGRYSSPRCGVTTN